MSYIELNGVRNTDLTGLLIQSLPPISKPAMRTEIEEIDGRDGDIITELGYAAYDRTVKIGLYGRFDINEVIAFFASKGKAVFSDEPDKYFFYNIIEQIDFERLLRFREAQVTFHCQPFKYREESITKTYDLMSIPDYSGSGVSVDDGEITISGAHSGAVSVPITEVEYEGAHYALTIRCSGIETGETVSLSVFGSTHSITNGTQVIVGEVEVGASLSSLDFTVTSTDADITLTASLCETANLLNIVNTGNIYARPVMTIYGAGTVGVYLDNAQIFSIDMADTGYITIDSVKMNAYKADILANRRVIGDYANFRLKVGRTEMSFTGAVTAVTITDYERWL